MTILRIIFAIFAAWSVTGCAGYRGGGDDDYYRGEGAGISGPIASPSMRPGMNPNDPRDAHFTTRPQPETSPDPTAVPP